MGATSHKTVTNRFPQVGGKRTSEAQGVVFDPTTGGEGMEIPPPPNDSIKASLSTSRRSPPFFLKRLANKQLFIQHVKHYQQWLCTAIPFKTKSGKIPSASVRIQGPSKRPSSGHLYPVSSVKECNRKGGKCKISRVLQSPVSSPQASPKVEAGHRLKQAQCFSTHRKVQNGNSRVHQGLPDSRGMGIVDRPIRCLPSYPHPPKLKEIPQDAGVPVHLPLFRTSYSPPGLYNDCKGSEAHGPLQRIQTSPIPGRLADQVPVSGGSPSEHSESGSPNPVLGVDNKSGKMRTETYSGVFVHGLRIPSRFSPCKTHSREMAQTSVFDPMTQVKTCFDCKMFDVANEAAR